MRLRSLKLLSKCQQCRVPRSSGLPVVRSIASVLLLHLNTWLCCSQRQLAHPLKLLLCQCVRNITKYSRGACRRTRLRVSLGDEKCHCRSSLANSSTQRWQRAIAVAGLWIDLLTIYEVPRVWLASGTMPAATRTTVLLSSASNWRKLESSNVRRFCQASYVCTCLWL